MSAEKAVYAILTTASAVEDLVGEGTSPETYRIYPIVAPQGTANPYVTYQRISSTREAHLRGALGECTARIQIDCYADDLGEAANLAEQVRISLDAFKGTAGGVIVTHTRLESDRSFYEDGVEPPLHRFSADYMLQFTETLPQSGSFDDIFSAEFA